MVEIRYADWQGTSDKNDETCPPEKIKQGLRPGERIVSVETVVDHLGIHWARVWILKGEKHG